MWWLQLVSVGLALKRTPNTIEELASWVYKDEAPHFTTVSKHGQVAVAGNDTASFKLSSLEILPYPLRAGNVQFKYLHNLVTTIPPGSEMTVDAFVDGDPWYSGTLNICEYLPFAKIDCPFEKYSDGPLLNTTTLQIPDNGFDSRFSFVAKVIGPSGDLILHVAAILDCVDYKDEL